MKYNTIPREPTRSMPNLLVLMGLAGVGKSVVAAKLTTHFALGKSQVISLGKEDGMENLRVVEQKIPLYKDFEPYIDNLIKDKPFDFIIVDNTTELEDFAIIQTTIEYMQSSRGKNFNLKARRENDKARGKGLSAATYKEYFLPGDKEFETILSLADGAGHLLLRGLMKRWFQKLRQAARFVIVLGHVRVNRYTKDTGKTTESTSLDIFTGCYRAISKYIDCLPTMYRKGDKAYLSFKAPTNDVAAKARYNYLDGQQILISEKEDNDVICYWENVYPEYKVES